MTEIVPQYYSFKIKLVVSDSILCFCIYFSIANKYRGCLRSLDVFFHTSNSFRTTFTFLSETPFRDTIQSGDHDSNNFRIVRKANFEINYKRIKTFHFLWQ